jgi:SAM-dependent methyltransferase
MLAVAPEPSRTDHVPAMSQTTGHPGGSLIAAHVSRVASLSAMPADVPAAPSSFRTKVAAMLPTGVKDLARPMARKVGLAAPAESWWEQTAPVWKEAEGRELRDRWCNVCRWSGSAFLGSPHTESANCPRCGSIARDRFLLWCFTSRSGSMRGARVIETSPRLGEEYRTYMQRWFSYRTSDFDLSAHRGDIQLDLQQIDLPDASVDVVLTPHVLEHVPDTDRALAELFRVIAPGGRMYLQVPLVYGKTAAPTTPEFHADNTPVFWNFGWDLTDRSGRPASRRRCWSPTSTTRCCVASCHPRIRTATASTSTRCSSTCGSTSSRPLPTRSRPAAWVSSPATTSPRGSACVPDALSRRESAQRPRTRRRTHILIMSRPSQNAFILLPVTELSPTRGWYFTGTCTIGRRCSTVSSIIS